TEGSSDNLEGRTIGTKPLNKYIEKAENKSQNENVKERVKASDIAVMTLDLTEGLLKLGENGQSFEDKYAGKSYFPYVTPYSQSNTGFTPAPEANDRVALYFPNGNETHAIVLGAVNNNGNGRFTDVANRNYHVGDSDFNMVLATNSLSTSAANSISQTANSISESADSISESAGNITNNSKDYSEIVDGTKSVVARKINQISTIETNISSTGDTSISSQGVSKVSGNKNVQINKG
ncbi:phage baseplate assembly protein V, partial [Leptotrichia sp. oral taxon 225]|uniref:phage baseplate assembly protein V n=2 Tax=unclassified Leptotrichia TaxID=2633022 RepID=UPI0003AE670B